MITVHTLAELRAQIKTAKASANSIGFVPTMGNLHAGHISLIERAKAECDFVVASIFVNPLQFDNPDDLSRYPRTLSDDQAKLSDAGCHLLFAPDVDEMYPSGQANHCKVVVPEVTDFLCGASRPGHFDGVATVVTKLFNMVQAERAFFGQKDFQQIAVIRKFVRELNIPIDIIAVPTQRDQDGLALSSRNGYLTAEERALAPGLYQTLKEVALGIQQGQPLDQLVLQGKARLTERGFIPDYLEVRRAQDLMPASHQDNDLVILAAAHLGKARLIDNLPLLVE